MIKERKTTGRVAGEGTKQAGLDRNQAMPQRIDFTGTLISMGPALIPVKQPNMEINRIELSGTFLVF